MSEAVEAILQVQRAWLYLESIFTGSDDIRRQLPSEAALFDGVNASFSRGMRELRQAANVVVATTRPGVLASFQVGFLFARASPVALARLAIETTQLAAQSCPCYERACQAVLPMRKAKMRPPPPRLHKPAVHGRRPGAHSEVPGRLPRFKACRLSPLLLFVIG